MALDHKASKKSAPQRMPGRLALVLLTAALVVAAHESRGAAQTCVGDCGGDGAIGLGEVQTGFNVFLGTNLLTECPSSDADDDGEVSLGEVQVSFNQYLGACGPGEDLMIVRGTCRVPAPDGLASCDQGTEVTVSRCDERSGCLVETETRTLLGAGFVGTVGTFSIALDGRMAVGGLLLVESEVEAAVLYRSISFGPVGQGAGTGDGPIVIEVALDPPNEAAVQLLDEKGLESFTDQGVSDVIDAVSEATQDVDFSGLTPEAAAQVASATAREDKTVQSVVVASRIPAFAFVTNYGSGTVSVIDTRSDSVVDTIEVGVGPLGIAGTADGASIIVVNQGAGNASQESVSIIDARARTVDATVDDFGPGIDSPFAIGITPGGRALVTSNNSRSIDVIDVGLLRVDPAASHLTRLQRPDGALPSGIALAQTQNIAYVADFDPGIAVIDTVANVVVNEVNVPRPVNQAPVAIALAPDDSLLYVATLERVFVVDTALALSSPDQAVVDDFTVDSSQTIGIAVAPEGDRVYVIGRDPDALWVVRSDTRVVVSKVEFLPDRDPSALALTPDGGRAYVSLSGVGRVAVVNTRQAVTDPDHAVTATLTVGNTPQFVTIVELP